MEELVASLKVLRWTLASCESVTGGDFASQVTDISGCSDVYAGGYIVYSNDAKHRLTHVPTEILEEFGAVSEETVKRLAIWTKNALSSDIAIAFSGNAGPGASSNQPVGRIYTAIAVNDDCFVYQDDFTGSRKQIKQQTIQAGIDRIMGFIHKENMR